MAQQLHDARKALVEQCSQSTSAEDVESLVRDLHRSANVCTRANVQRCTARIVALVIPSATRTSAICRFLSALSKSFATGTSKRTDAPKAGEDNTGLGRSPNGEVQQPPQPHFKRLHVLYVISDVLVTLQSLANATHDQLNADSVGVFKRYLPSLAALATFTGDGRYARTYPRVLSLLRMWSDARLASEPELTAIFAQVNLADRETNSWEAFRNQTGPEEADPRSEATDQERLTLPARHGVPNDPAAPWYELPAGNGMYMKRTKGYPLRASALPVGGYELEDSNNDDVLDSMLAPDVQWLHHEMLHAFEKFTDPEAVQDVDPLGNIIYKDPDRPTRNYWGWTLDGVKKMEEISIDEEERAVGYDGIGTAHAPNSMAHVNAAVERARSLAAERAGGMRGRGGGQRGGGRGWRGGRRW